MKLASAPPAVKVSALPPSLYRTAEPRLARARHDAANAFQSACLRGHRRTAIQFARVVDSCDEALGILHRRTQRGWDRLMADLMGGGR